MASWANGPLLCLDFETTSADPTVARPVSVAAVVLQANGEIDGSVVLVDAGVEIPEETIAIHGITASLIAEQGKPADVACTEVLNSVRVAIWQEWPIVIFNARFDWTLLMAEAARFGEIVPDGVAIIDPAVIDRHRDKYRKGRRTLAATAEHYKVELIDAHSAIADAVATGTIARRLAATFPDLALMPAAELHKRQAEWYESWRVGFNQYLRKKDPNAEPVAPGWPIPAVTVAHG